MYRRSVYTLPDGENSESSLSSWIVTQGKSTYKRNREAIKTACNSHVSLSPACSLAQARTVDIDRMLLTGGVKFQMNLLIFDIARSVVFSLPSPTFFSALNKFSDIIACDAESSPCGLYKTR